MPREKVQGRQGRQDGGVYFNFLGEFRSGSNGKAFKRRIPTIAVSFAKGS